MQVRLTGAVTNLTEAVREVQHVYPEAPNTTKGELSERMLGYMVDLLRRGESRNLFLWLLKVTLDVTAPEYWWHQGEAYFTERTWVRRHPAQDRDRSLLTQEDFEGGIPRMVLETLNDYIRREERDLLASTMPESFIRRAYVQTDYAELRQLYLERGHYDSGHWKDLSSFIRSLPYSSLITTEG